MALYSSTNTNAGQQQAVSASYKTLLSLAAVATTLTSARIYDVLIGTDGTPADNAMDWDISRQTAAGTATVTTPNPLDPGTRAAGSGAAANYTAEGTVTSGSSVFAVGINQRASYRWVAAPGSELIVPAVAAAGFALRTKSAGYTGTATATIFHSE